MRRTIIIALTLVAIGVSIIGLKFITPLSYAEASIRDDACKYVMALQSQSQLTPEALACQYLYFGSSFSTRSIPWWNPHRQPPRRNLR